MNNPEQAVLRANRLKQFMEDEIVDGALKELATRYYGEFRKATSSELRVQAWAKSNVLEDFLTELQVVLTSGEQAALEIAQRARQPHRG